MSVVLLSIDGEKGYMATRNLSKTFKGKVNGQRLPPLPVANDSSVQPAATIQHENPPSILKKPKPSTDDELLTNPLDDDDVDCSRVIFQKSQADILLLLDTYPPKTWSIPKCLRSSLDPIVSQDPLPHQMIDTLFTSDQQNDAMIETFPAPLSDRLPSSRYCRRSVSSACSRRSSILFPRHPTTIPFDGSHLRREDTFDTVCESLAETLRASYTPLPPIVSDPSSNNQQPPLPLSKSLTEKTSISPPLIVEKDNPAIQEKKEQFTRRLLTKNLNHPPAPPHREEILNKEKTMDSPQITQRSTTIAPIKPLVAPRVQKSTIENQRRFNSVERNPVPAPTSTITSRPTRTVPPAVSSSAIATPTAATAAPVSTTTNVRSSKFSLDIFQPQSKAIQPTTTTTTAMTTPKKTTCKSKSTLKAAAAATTATTTMTKVKGNANTPDQETMAPQSDVIPPPIEKQTEVPEIPIVKTNDESSKQIPVPSKSSSHHPARCIHPVPKPLTLQGEKTVDADYPQSTARPMISCQRRGSLKGQPLIMELFEDTTVEANRATTATTSQMAINPVMKSTGVKLKKQRANFVKSAKQKKKPAAKAKTTVTVMSKTDAKSKSLHIEMKEEEKKIIVGGTDWVMTVQPALIQSEDPLLSSLFDAPTVDDEDLPVCTSPTDDLGISQCTLMTSAGDLDREEKSSVLQQRRNSLESLQAIEISPVLTQMIEPAPIDPPPPPVMKPTETQLINTDIRTIYGNVQDSIRKNSSLRSLPRSPPNKSESNVSKTSISSSNQKTLPFETSTSGTHTFNNQSNDLSNRPAFRVVNDSLNSRGSETIGSTESQDEFNSMPLCTEADCDEIYRTARKGRQVGRGAYGIVYAYLTSAGQMIAVKEIELDENDSERVRDDYESVREEVNILRALDHPYIVKFLGIALESTRLIKIFMEYLPNGTIENLLASFGPFHNDVLKKYTRQIVEGVAYLHDNGVVHRDIKGKNIMLDVNGNIKLIDFGCAKRLKKNQNTHSMRHLLKSMKGTANWMAPEVIAETGHGKKADIWSIGCTLCEMATGKPPWSSEHNHLAVLLIIANGTKPPADLPSTCPLSAQEFFRLCLTRDPTQRPSARDLLTHPFLTS